MKKVLIGLVVGLVLIVVVVGGLVFYGSSNINKFVKTVIETAGTDAVGSSVQVGSVEINLMGGTASIFDLTVANPEGFSDQAMVSFSELSITLDLANITGELIGIKSIIARDPFVRYETGDGPSNIDVVSERFASDETSSTDAESEYTGPSLEIGEVLIENIQASLESNLLSNPLDVSLGDINLQNLKGTPEEIAAQVMKPVMSQIASSAGEALLSALGDIDIGELGELAKEQVGEQLEGLEDKAKEALDDVLSDDLKESLGNLFGR